jgi:hypothetical protein
MAPVGKRDKARNQRLIKPFRQNPDYKRSPQCDQSSVALLFQECGEEKEIGLA